VEFHENDIEFHVVSYEVSAIKKYQITKHQHQTNYNDRNSKFQTIGVWSYLRFGY